VAKNVNHWNYFYGDKNKVYCKQRDAIINVTDISKACSSCKMYSGDIRGQGIECAYPDRNTKETVIEIYNPYER
jgi:hypothetical protein